LPSGGGVADGVVCCARLGTAPLGALDRWLLGLGKLLYQKDRCQQSELKLAITALRPEVKAEMTSCDKLSCDALTLTKGVFSMLRDEAAKFKALYVLW